MTSFKMLTQEDEYDADERIVLRHLEHMLQIVAKHPNSELYFGLEDKVNSLKEEFKFIQDVIKNEKD